MATRDRQPTSNLAHHRQLSALNPTPVAPTHPSPRIGTGPSSPPLAAMRGLPSSPRRSEPTPPYTDPPSRSMFESRRRPNAQQKCPKTVVRSIRHPGHLARMPIKWSRAGAAPGIGELSKLENPVAVFGDELFTGAIFGGDLGASALAACCSHQRRTTNPVRSTPQLWKCRDTRTKFQTSRSPNLPGAVLDPLQNTL